MCPRHDVGGEQARHCVHRPRQARGSAALTQNNVLLYMGAARSKDTGKLPKEFEEDANRFVLFSAHDVRREARAN